MKHSLLRNLKLLSPSVVAALFLSTAGAASTVTYPGAEDFTATPVDWVANITIDEVSGAVLSLLEEYSSDGSTGLVQALAEIGPSTTPALDAQRSPVNTGTAIGRARTTDALTNIADASGVFYGNIGERIRISSTTSMTFELEYVGSDPSSGGIAVICLMPIQLAIIEGISGALPAEAIYSYQLDVDGEEIYSSSMSLSGTSASVQLSALDGALRTDGVFFSDPNYDTFGFNFPAITIEVPMGFFESGNPLEANLTFTTAIEASDSDWGGYAGPSSPTAPANIFVPISGALPVPEPESMGLLVIGLLVMLRRRAR